ncbi:SpoIIE family protein phosphatase [Streptomyces scabiei]|uniref:SpoIIE family protein phosphatase n=1 Tax=Streptomyces scabiei TaxID=1930 RepID=UPI00068BAEA4|nr:SpoIIE family protein phosphatase [Streptomyces scabiei]
MDRRGKPPDRRTRPQEETHLNASVTVTVTDAVGRVAYWSRQAQELLGYTSKEIVGRPLADLLSPDGAMFRHRDGHVLGVQARLSPLLDANQEPATLVTAVPAPYGRAPTDDTLIRWMFDQQPRVLAIWDLDGRALKANEAAAGVAGFPDHEVRGQMMTDFLRGPGFAEVERRILRVGRTGVPESIEHVAALPQETRAHAWAVHIFPLKDADGRVHAVGMAAEDYSAQYNTGRRLALMSEARTRIGMTLDPVGTTRELADVVVPRFADFIGIDLHEAVLQGALPPPGSVTGPARLRRAAQRSSHPLPPDALIDSDGVHTPPPSSPLARCLAGGAAELRDLTDPDIIRWLKGDPLHAAHADALGARSLIVLPIRAHGVVLGTVLLFRYATSPDPFDPEDLAITEDLVARAAVCLDNARRFVHERTIALTLQRSMLVGGPRVHPTVETASRYVAAGGGANAGGDWFDVIPLSGARVGFVAGDVVGHGIGASATMGRLRMAVRTLADIDLPPDELLTHLDDIVTHSAPPESADAEIPGDIGATCVYGVYNPVSRTCALARAGHPAPILVRPDGTTDVIDVPAGPPLGLGSLPFEATELQIPEGSVLAVFTDGLCENRDHDIDEGILALRQALARPAPSLAALCDTALDTLRPSPGTDDAALLLIRALGLSQNSLAMWELPSDPAVVAEARRLARDRLTAWAVEDASFVTELVVSELVTNAIRHADGPIQLRLIKDRTLTCEVSDGSTISPHLRRARLNDEGGRGLLLVAQLTERWGTRYTAAGKTIWAEQLIDPVGTQRADRQPASALG